MIERTLEPCLIAKGFRFTESPHFRDDLLWFSDMHLNRVFGMDDAGTVQKSISVPGGPVGLGWMPDGRMLIVATFDRVVYRLEGDELVLHADLSKLGDTANPLNDICVGPDGSCYVGEVGVEINGWLSENLPKVNHEFAALRELPEIPEAILFHILPDGTVLVGAEGLRFPNGATVTPDARLIIAESLGYRVSIFDVRDGRLTNRRKVSADFAPDGLSDPDADGCVWVADPLGQSIRRLSPSGEWLARVHTSRSVFACATSQDRPDKVYLCVNATPDPCRTETLLESSIEVVDISPVLAALSR